AQITAEEPANAEYTSQVVDTHLTLGRLLADADRSEEGFAEVRQATAILEKAAAGPKAVEAGERLAACLLAMGDIHWDAGKTADAASTWARALRLLTAAVTENPKNPALEAALAAAED